MLAAVAAVVLAHSRRLGPGYRLHRSVSADAVGILNPRTGSLTGQVPVGASPSAVAACDGSIWTANGDAHSVSRVNAAKQVMIRDITVGNGPDGIACGGGFIWVANGLDGTVTKIDPQIDQPVDTIERRKRPGGRGGGSGRYVWVANSNDGTRSADRPAHRQAAYGDPDRPERRRRRRRLQLGLGHGSGERNRDQGRSEIGERHRSRSRPGAAPDAVTTGVGSGLGREQSRRHRVTGSTRRPTGSRAGIPVGDGPNGLARGRFAVWVSNGLAGTLTKIDATSERRRAAR